MPQMYSTLTGIRSRSSIKADQIERNSERDDVLEEKQAEIVHVMDAVNHDGVIRSRDQHGACGEEHADQNDPAQNTCFRFEVANDQQDCCCPFSGPDYIRPNIWSKDLE